MVYYYILPQHRHREQDSHRSNWNSYIAAQLDIAIGGSLEKNAIINSQIQSPLNEIKLLPKFPYHLFHKWPPSNPSSLKPAVAYKPFGQLLDCGTAALLTVDGLYPLSRQNVNGVPSRRNHVNESFIIEIGAIDSQCKITEFWDKNPGANLITVKAGDQV
ncbi:hypothetical protein BT96DRAFT_992122 [Gymnopus androsaceus JB14]|uniref:Uncharacterized protein n=1 Tax=Gymnopus androsaceus JB14 TaxID=1447944 RepID=A0A6A4HX07_9AGAR|nr:hypothetical protein BT96DRAFT_992122 [Gymnopus androsaceus JB14]